MPEKQICGFSEAWLGACKLPAPCEEHDELKCCSCGAPATHSCGETGQFVCGSPLCDACEHTTFPNGTNGGIGFNAQPCPEGMERHVRKEDQCFDPWYVQEARPATAAKDAPCPLCGGPSRNDDGWGCSSGSCDANSWVLHHNVWIAMSRRVVSLLADNKPPEAP